jgi:hypothetical protein
MKPLTLFLATHGSGVRGAGPATAWCLVLLLSSSLRVPAQPVDALPVYSVVQSGALPAQAAALASSLGIAAGAFTLTNGEMHFVDPTAFMGAPVLPVVDPTIQSNLLADTINKVPGIPIRLEQPDFLTLSNLVVPGSNTVVASFSSALASAGLLPQSATPIITHTMLTAFYTNDTGALLSVSNYLDTHVSHQMVLQGLPVVGPGAQVQAAYGPNGAVTRLHYAARKLAMGPMVSLISATVASNRAAALYPGLNGPVTAQLVYFAPPLAITTVSNLIPWYLCGGTTTVTNPASGQTATLDLMRVLIPATDDPRYVPSVSLSAIANQGGTQVVASANVTGGTPPYAYLWSGSAPGVSSNTGPRVTYAPVIEVAPAQLMAARPAPGALALSWVDSSGRYQLESAPNLDPASWGPVTTGVTHSNSVGSLTLDTGSQPQFFRLRLSNQPASANDTVSVGVLDQNGVSVRTSQNLAVQAMPFLPPVQFNGPLVGWGTEGPYSGGFMSWDTASWRQSMQTYFVFGAERYYQGEFVADRLDFIDAPTGNNDLVVDSADITFYAGHGNPNVITFTSIFGQPDTPTGLLFNTDVNRCWGNRQQEWLALLSCEVLAQYDGDSHLAFQRWGPAFDGLHLMLGFSSEAWSRSITGIGGDSFETVFVKGMAGQNPWVLTIQQAWFDAALTTGPLFQSGGVGDPAVLGPIAAGGVWDLGDAWWGVGPVGPRIRAGNIRGWYYLTHTS